MLNKRADAPSLIVLAVATIAIVMILTGFIVLSGIIKAISGDKSSEKVYYDGDVGVGDLKDPMKDYERLVLAEVKIRRGESVDAALESVEYGKRPEVIPVNYYGMGLNYPGGYYGIR